MERTVRVRENGSEVAHSDSPVDLSDRKLTTVRGYCNRVYSFTVLNGGDNGRESRPVQERDGRASIGSNKFAIWCGRNGRLVAIESGRFGNLGPR